VNASEFISTLVMHFPVRHDSEAREREWLGSLIATIKHYEGAVLRRAAQHIVDTRTDRRFPLPAEIRKVCAEVAADERRASLPIDAPKGVDASSPERQRLAREMMRTSIGRDAARNGWIGALHNFALRHGRLPSVAEIPGVKQAAADLHETMAWLKSDEPAWCKREWMALGLSMLARQDELAKDVLGE